MGNGGKRSGRVAPGAAVGADASGAQRSSSTAAADKDEVAASRVYTHGEIVPFEEDETHEFKRCSEVFAKHVWAPGGDIIKNVVGFLNSRDGGTLYLGLEDDGAVIGTALSRSDRDKFRLAVNRMLRFITPSVLPGLVSISFIPVVGQPVATQTTDAVNTLSHSAAVGIETLGNAVVADGTLESAQSTATEPPEYRTWRNARQTGETNSQKRKVYMAAWGHLLHQQNGSQRGKCASTTASPPPPAPPTTQLLQGSPTQVHPLPPPPPPPLSALTLPDKYEEAEVARDAFAIEPGSPVVVADAPAATTVVVASSTPPQEDTLTREVESPQRHTPKPPTSPRSSISSNNSRARRVKAIISAQPTLDDDSPKPTPEPRLPVCADDHHLSTALPSDDSDQTLGEVVVAAADVVESGDATASQPNADEASSLRARRGSGRDKAHQVVPSRQSVADALHVSGSDGHCNGTDDDNSDDNAVAVSITHRASVSATADMADEALGGADSCDSVSDVQESMHNTDTLVESRASVADAAEGNADLDHVLPTNTRATQKKQTSVNRKERDRCVRCDRAGHSADKCWQERHRVTGTVLDVSTAAPRTGGCILSSSPTSPNNTSSSSSSALRGALQPVVVEIAVRAGLSRAQPIPYETGDHVAYCRRAGETGPLTGTERFQLTEMVLRGRFANSATTTRARSWERRKPRSRLCAVM
jgi:hypothetical protein